MTTITEIANRQMDTISTVLNRLKRRKQDNEFVINEKGVFMFDGRSYGQLDIKIIKTYRFEGESDPADGAILYLIMTEDGIIGYSLDAYGVYSNHSGDEYADLMRKMPMYSP